MTMSSSAGTTTYSTPSDREIVMTRVFDAPRRLVFEAHTNPEHPPKWMTGPEGWAMPVCEIDLRPGGSWHFVWTKSDGEQMEMRGAYRDIDPPERIVSTESWGEGWPETINTLVLTEQDGRTTLTNTMLFPTKADRDRALETGMEDGTDLSYDRLAAVLGTLAS